MVEERLVMNPKKSETAQLISACMGQKR